MKAPCRSLLMKLKRSTLQTATRFCARRGNSDSSLSPPPRRLSAKWTPFTSSSHGKAELSCVNSIVSGSSFSRLRHDHQGKYSGTHNESSRSEERRVGKECRYRWSPYH